MPKRGRWEYQCHACGMKFRTPLADTRHRHNWPALCRRNKQFEAHMAKYFPPEKKDAAWMLMEALDHARGRIE